MRFWYRRNLGETRKTGIERTGDPRCPYVRDAQEGFKPGELEAPVALAQGKDALDPARSVARRETELCGIETERELR